MDEWRRCMARERDIYRVEPGHMCSASQLAGLLDARDALAESENKSLAQWAASTGQTGAAYPSIVTIAPGVRACWVCGRTHACGASDEPCVLIYNEEGPLAAGAWARRCRNSHIPILQASAHASSRAAVTRPSSTMAKPRTMTSSRTCATTCFDRAWAPAATPWSSCTR